jgi:hypothetical protein
VAAALFAIFAVMVTAALRYPPEARLVPLVVGIPALILAGWQLWREIVRQRSAATEAARPAAPGRRVSTEGASVAWLAAFALMVLAGGFVVGGTLAVMACQRFWLRESWRTTLAGGAVALFITYGCFERALGLALYGGWIAGRL